MCSILKPITDALAYLEGDGTPLSAVYATFVLIKVHIHEIALATWTALGYKGDAKAHLLGRLVYQFERISTPVHALVFRCDPVFDGMRQRVSTKYGVNFINIGSNELLATARSAIDLLLRKENEERQYATLEEFCAFCERVPSPVHVFAAMANLMPRLVWGQARGLYPNLADLLVRVFSCPTSAAAGERNHKTSKAILTRNRASLLAAKVEMQCAIAYNASQKTRLHVTLRSSKFNTTLVDLLQPQEDVVPVVLLNQVEESSIVADESFDDGFDFDGQDIDCILDTILDTLAFDQIPDRLLFGEEA